MVKVPQLMQSLMNENGSSAVNGQVREELDVKCFLWEPGTYRQNSGCFNNFRVVELFL